MALSREAIEQLFLFLETASVGNLQPHDKKQWRDFIIQAHNNGDEIRGTAVSEAIRAKGWIEQVASELGSDYYEGRMLLAQYDEMGGPEQ